MKTFKITKYSKYFIEVEACDTAEAIEKASVEFQYDLDGYFVNDKIEIEEVTGKNKK